MSLLKELGTVTFDVEVMTASIGMHPNDPTILWLGPWLSLVPDKYRPLAGACADAVSSRYLREHATPAMLYHFIHELRSACLREIQMETQEGYLR